MKQQRRWWGVPAWSIVAVALVLVQVGLDAGLDVGRIPGGPGTVVVVWALWALICGVAAVGMCGGTVARMWARWGRKGERRWP